MELDQFLRCRMWFWLGYYVLLYERGELTTWDAERMFLASMDWERKMWSARSFTP